MRFAKSYSIVDHQLLHGRYLQRLSHKAMALYLFLVVVADRHGKSFYSPQLIIDILRFSAVEEFSGALAELTKEHLVWHKHPFFWINNLEQLNGQSAQSNKLSSQHSAALISADRETNWDSSKALLQTILKRIQTNAK